MIQYSRKIKRHIPFSPSFHLPRFHFGSPVIYSLTSTLSFHSLGEIRWIFKHFINRPFALIRNANTHKLLHNRIIVRANVSCSFGRTFMLKQTNERTNVYHTTNTRQSIFKQQCRILYIVLTTSSFHSLRFSRTRENCYKIFARLFPWKIVGLWLGLSSVKTY